MDTVGLLMGLIRIPSFSREEGAAADFLEAWMRKNGFAEIHRAGNNLWVESGPQDERPTILLNAHIDTVKPSPGYTRDPFEPALEGDVLYGLGSNDDGGSLVALMETYSLLLSKPQPYRLVISATAEEEVCGKGGFDVFLQRAGKIDFGIIGEPTAMNMAVAEKGLMVLDCTAHGVSGHAARNEGLRGSSFNRVVQDSCISKGFRISRVGQDDSDPDYCRDSAQCDSRQVRFRGGCQVKRIIFKSRST